MKTPHARKGPILAWGDFHARSRFARSTIPEENWGTTSSLYQNAPTILLLSVCFSLTSSQPTLKGKGLAHEERFNNCDLDCRYNLKGLADFLFFLVCAVNFYKMLPSIKTSLFNSMSF